MCCHSQLPAPWGHCLTPLASRPGWLGTLAVSSKSCGSKLLNQFTCHSLPHKPPKDHAPLLCFIVSFSGHLHLWSANLVFSFPFFLSFMQLHLEANGLSLSRRQIYHRRKMPTIQGGLFDFRWLQMKKRSPEFYFLGMLSGNFSVGMKGEGEQEIFMPNGEIWVTSKVEDYSQSKSNWPLKSIGLNCAGPLVHNFFSISMLEKFLEICSKLNKLTDKPHSLEISEKLKKKLGMIWINKI